MMTPSPRTSSERNIHTVTQELRGIFLFVGAIWLVFVLDRFLPFEQLALYPRRLEGLPGILLSPFLHRDFSHLFGNSIPLFILLMLLAGSRANSGRTVALLVIVSGAMLWLLGRPYPVIGASGLVFALIGFLLLSGLLERRPRALIVSVIVFFSYGGTLLLGILPGQPGVSWDGHLYGAVAGGLVAWWVTRKPASGLAKRTN